jgi:peptidoglycan/xylan/chitin deacetylase (PgdA/CDA1 family)
MQAPADMSRATATSKPRHRRSLLGRARASGLRTVLYHHITDRPSELVDALRVATPPSVFEAHLERFVRHYDVVDLDDVLSGRLPKRPLLITFDDGYRSIRDVAGPLLKRHDLPSVFFVSAAFVEPGSLPLDNLLCWLSHRYGLAALEREITGGPAMCATLRDLMVVVAAMPLERRIALGDELARRFGVDRRRLREESGLFLDSDELPALAGLRMEIGNHTRSHLHCRALVGRPAQLAAEVVDHRRRLEEWSGTEVRSFSYPYGSRSDAAPEVESALARSGHRATFLVESRSNPRGHGGPSWHRVSFQAQPASRLYVRLAVLPRLRAIKDRVDPRHQPVLRGQPA